MNFLGDDLLQWLVLALGSALAVGNLLALVRPKEQLPKNPVSKNPAEPQNKDATKAPFVRSIIMIVLGTGVSIWALASLLT